MIALLCEFCCRDTVEKLYPCAPYRNPGDLAQRDQPTMPSSEEFLFEDLGGWGACRACGELIDSTAIERLVERAYRAAHARAGSSVSSRPLDYYRTLFLWFFEHRGGPALTEYEYD
jgi:hypothetical protein